MKKILFLSLLLFCTMAGVAQSQHVTLKFMGQSADSIRVQMEYVEVKNLSSDSTIWADSLVLEWPDTVLTMTVDKTPEVPTAIASYADAKGFAFTQIGPNPFRGQTEVALQLTENGNVLLRVFELTGKQVAVFSGNFQQGVHRFQIRAAMTQTYLVTAQCGSKYASMKLVNVGQGSGNGISYVGSDIGGIISPKTEMENAYHYGDTLMCAGYVHFGDSLYASDTVLLIMDSMQDSLQNIVLNFHVQQPSVETWLPDVMFSDSVFVGGTVINDGGILVGERGILWAEHPIVTLEDNRIVLGDTLIAIGDTLYGVPGDFSTMLLSLEPNKPYFVRAYAMTELGESYGQEFAILTLSQLRDNQPCTVENVTDADGNVYATVRIGRQCWTRENLRTTQYNDSLVIVNVATLQDVDLYSDTIAYSYYPNSNAEMMDVYGLLYNYRAASVDSERSFGEPSGIQGICPTGWHVPSVGEWEQLTGYLEGQRMYHAGDISSNIAKALASQDYWMEDTEYTFSIGNRLENNNATGFAALPAGAFADSVGGYGRFWSCSGEQPTELSVLRLSYNLPNVAFEMLAPDAVASVRCVRDEEELVDGYACPGMPTVTDVDGNVYHTILVGNQCWMRENLRTTHYADYTAISQDAAMTDSIASYYQPDVEESEISLYGLQYNWFAVDNDAQNLCPEGWHVPTQAEWMQLHHYVASKDEYRCGSGANSISKSLAVDYEWHPSSSPCDAGDTTTVHNVTGFSAFPAGCYPNNNAGITAYFWTSTESDVERAVARYINYSTPNFSEGNLRKTYGASIRCLKD